MVLTSVSEADEIGEDGISDELRFISSGLSFLQLIMPWILTRWY
jgi:hypothetical protein